MYDREFVVDTLVARYARPHDDPWAISDFKIRQLEGAVWLVTYELEQNDRRSRRMTIWRRCVFGWIAEYHQGTLS